MRYAVEGQERGFSQGQVSLIELGWQFFADVFRIVEQRGWERVSVILHSCY